jgi:hypothetical protein
MSNRRTRFIGLSPLTPWYASCIAVYRDRPLGKYMMFDPTAGLMPPKDACCLPKTEQGNGPQKAFDESKPWRAKSVMLAPVTAFK